MLKKHKAENWQNKPIYLVYKLFKLIILTLNSCCIGYRLSEILLKNLSILHYLLKIGHYSILNDIVIVVLECLLLFGCSINYCITRIFQMVKNYVPIHNLKHLFLKCMLLPIYNLKTFIFENSYNNVFLQFLLYKL